MRIIEGSRPKDIQLQLNPFLSQNGINIFLKWELIDFIKAFYTENQFGIILAQLELVFHRILDLKRGGISIRAPFFMPEGEESSYLI